MKSCSRCKFVKPIWEFSKHPKQSLGLQSQCKACFAERARNKRVGNPCMTCGKPKEVGVSKGSRICLECAKTCFVCKAQPRQKQHRVCKQCQAARDKIRNAVPHRKRAERITRIKSKYKVDRETAEALADENVCRACGQLAAPGQAHVDHCHESGAVRGILCFNCNASLGHLGDSLERLCLLVAYLAPFKNGVEDLLKARDYLDKLIASTEGK